MMAGRMWVESAPGAGSSFHFTASFEISPVSLADAGEALLPLPPVPVLIVDDNAVNRRILREQVARWGMTPTTADSGPAAIDALTRGCRRRPPVPPRAAGLQHARPRRLLGRRTDSGDVP
jgi:hypothetical protein